VHTLKCKGERAHEIEKEAKRREREREGGERKREREVKSAKVAMYNSLVRTTARTSFETVCSPPLKSLNDPFV